MAGTGQFGARVVVHDFSGHPFQVQLARELWRRGYRSTHMYCPSFQTPKGNVGDADADDDGAGEEEDAAASFRSIPVPLWRPFAKYSGGKRLVQELEYGVRSARAMLALKPDIVLTANTPLIAAVVLQVILKVRRVPIVFWQQDVYSIAMAGHLQRKGGRLGSLAGRVLIRLEQWLLHSSNQIVVISEDFLDILGEWGADLDRVTVVENWAPLDELPMGQRSNRWSRKHGIGDELVFLYAGSLGLKHEPSLLLDLAKAFSDRDDVRVIVASEGRGAKWLQRERTPQDGLELLPFQDYADLPDMLASADVLLVLLQPDAGAFSVPSKVLTYHCAGRAILGAIPEENLAARTILRNQSGMVVSPGDAQRFVSEAKRLADDPYLRRDMGLNGRTYAEQAFDMKAIGDLFDDVLDAAVGRQSPEDPTRR